MTTRKTAQKNSAKVCITCGVELHPERAVKYDYCTAEKCQRENATGLTMLAVGVNKSAEQFEVLNERTRTELASGKYHDQRRASYGKPADRGQRTATRAAIGRRAPSRNRSAGPVRPAWTDSQQRLALLYNQRGVRPDEIAEKLHVSRYLVTQMILAGRQQKR